MGAAAEVMIPSMRSVKLPFRSCAMVWISAVCSCW